MNACVPKKHRLPRQALRLSELSKAYKLHMPITIGARMAIIPGTSQTIAKALPGFFAGGACL